MTMQKLEKLLEIQNKKAEKSREEIEQRMEEERQEELRKGK